MALIFLKVYAGLLGLMFCFQSRLIFFPSKLDKNLALSFPGKFTENFLKINSTGEMIHYLEFTVDSPKGVILYFHGNADSLVGWGFVALELAKATQRNVWIMDYPGFGKSDSNIPQNEEILLEMGREFIEKIKRQYPKLQLTLYGRSVGTGIAGELAKDQMSVNSLILETPYLSLKKLANDLYPWVPSFLIRFDLDNRDILKKRPQLPVLILHGTKDEVIPFRHGKKLAETLGESVHFISFENGHHNDLSNFERYWPTITEFLTSASSVNKAFE